MFSCSGYGNRRFRTLGVRGTRIHPSAWGVRNLLWRKLRPVAEFDYFSTRFPRRFHQTKRRDRAGDRLIRSRPVGAFGSFTHVRECRCEGRRCALQFQPHSDHLSSLLLQEFHPELNYVIHLAPNAWNGH